MIKEQRKKQTQQIFLNSETILRYLIGDDDKLDTLIMCKSSEIELLTTDLNLHEAVGSIIETDKFNLKKLAKFCEVVNVVSYENLNHEKKPVLTFEKMEELRKTALEK